MAGSGSRVTGSKLRFWFIEQINFAGKGIDLLDVGSDAFVDLCIDTRRGQFARPARSLAHWL
ncbi:MAG: hypothetical protein DMF40_08445 [Verrucomicrobia bacterium]|nr:MAG: hypothetical protein DMF40_08445 [Verrucomicrobiota bacterium]